LASFQRQQDVLRAMRRHQHGHLAVQHAHPHVQLQVARRRLVVGRIRRGSRGGALALVLVLLRLDQLATDERDFLRPRAGRFRLVVH
jgi:hypothetical protein